MSEPRIIAEITADNGWNGLLEAFRLGFDDFRITYEVGSEMASMPDRYFNKLFSPIPMRQLGPVSFNSAMWATGIKFLAVVDEGARDKLRRNKHFRVRRPGPARHANGTMPTRKKRVKSPFRGNSAWGKVMRARGLLRKSPKQRSAQARRAAVIRWADVKAAAMGSP